MQSRRAVGCSKDQATENSWGRWSMFTVNVRNGPEGSPASDPTLLLLPIHAGAQASPPLEEVFLVRDEVANMAWGEETTVALATGISRPGSEVAKQTFNYLQGLIPDGATPPPMTAPVRYQAMNSVPENWIPFIATHQPGSNRQIRLQRGSMPRLTDVIPTYTRFDVGAGWTHPDGRISINGYVNNVFNIAYATSITAGGDFNLRFYNSPRTAGVSAWPAPAREPRPTLRRR